MFLTHQTRGTVRSNHAVISFFIVLSVVGTGTVALGQNKSEYKVGDQGPGGGIVFHINHDGSGGLEAAPTDLQNPHGPIDLDNPDQKLPLHSWDEVASKTKKYVWPNGQTDGYIPNKDELEALFEQRELIGGFAEEYYWSSSIYSDDRSWFKNFDTGLTGHGYTAANRMRVRPIRVF